MRIDPQQWKALALAGSAAFERKDYKTAIGYWQKLQSRAEPGSELAREAAANIEEARQLGGIKVLATAQSGRPDAKPQVQARRCQAARADGQRKRGRAA